jgi:hypothetical protein
MMSGGLHSSSADPPGGSHGNTEGRSTDDMAVSRLSQLICTSALLPNLLLILLRRLTAQEESLKINPNVIGN